MDNACISANKLATFTPKTFTIPKVSHDKDNPFRDGYRRWFGWY